MAGYGRLPLHAFGSAPEFAAGGLDSATRNWAYTCLPPPPPPPPLPQPHPRPQPPLPRTPPPTSHHGQRSNRGIDGGPQNVEAFGLAAASPRGDGHKKGLTAFCLHSLTAGLLLGNGSLDFNFLGKTGVFHQTPQKVINLFAGGSRATEIAS